MPYKTAVGTTYDSGEFEAILDKALALADYAGFKQRKREAARSAASIAASASPACSNTPAARRSKARRCCSPAARPRCWRSTCSRPARATPRCFPCIAAERLGIPGREGPPSARRFRPRASRHGLGRLALGHDGRQRHRSRPSRPCWPRARPSRPRCWKPPRPTSPTRPAASRWSAPTGASRCSSSPRAPPR